MEQNINFNQLYISNKEKQLAFDVINNTYMDSVAKISENISNAPKDLYNNLDRAYTQLEKEDEELIGRNIISYKEAEGVTRELVILRECYMKFAGERVWVAQNWFLHIHRIVEVHEFNKGKSRRDQIKIPKYLDPCESVMNLFKKLMECLETQHAPELFISTLIKCVRQLMFDCLKKLVSEDMEDPQGNFSFENLQRLFIMCAANSKDLYGALVSFCDHINEFIMYGGSMFQPYRPEWPTIVAKFKKGIHLIYRRN